MGVTKRLRFEILSRDAHPDDEWSYFCGVVWQTYRRAQEVAGS